MPHRDGFWLFNAIRSMPGTTVTALAMPREREAILAAGFAAYLVKPLDPDEVIAVVARCVGRGR
jgi:CheY-like chemotaxis protein